MFPLGLLAGLALGRTFGVAPGPVADAGMTIALGLLVAAERRMHTALLCAAALGIAILRGAANAGGVGPETNQLLFAAGLAAAGYAAITLSMASTHAFRHPAASVPAAWRSIAVRACGSWIAAIGLMMGGFALAS